MFEDDRPDKNKARTFPANFNGMSIEELENYMVDLHDESTRTKLEIDRKKSSMDAAASVFKL